MSQTPAIHIENLSKTFGRDAKHVAAVSNLSLDIAAGQVYGFLGPNGAGKTTTIRMMMDLIRPTQGAVQIHGRDARQPGALKRVGALVEGPAFYGYLSAERNLELLARTANDYRPERIRVLLEQVGLAARARQSVGGYSLGMKQRLGIAAALLDDPDLVILDEPTNGLDPAGIQEMRGFIRALVTEQGKTVFLSSHLLNEVEQVCDRVAIIHRGALVREGAVADLLAEGRAELRAQVSPIEKAEAVLSAHWPVKRDENSSAGPGWLTINTRSEDSPHLVQVLVASEVNVHQIVIHRQSLEEYFMAVTHTEGDAAHV